jgi:hypothetical protein
MLLSNGKGPCVKEKGYRSQDDARLHLILSIFMVEVLKMFKCFSNFRHEA